MTNNDFTDDHYLAALYAFLPFGPARTKLLIKHFESAKGVWKATEKELLETGLRKDLVNKFVRHRRSFNLSKYFSKLKKLEINFVTLKSEGYPSNLKDLDNAPLVLYFIGSLKADDDNAVAIVGSRKMTSYGREVARSFSETLGSYGVTIVSGLALGIDAVAHKAAIDTDGRTVAVLASGLDIITPKTNFNIAKAIINKRKGAIVSEYPLGVAPRKEHFANRNRIISGLSKAVIVVEGLKKSGTLLTASAAAEQGREVFAVPGQITSPLSEAPHFLIKNGVKFAFSPKEILEELDMQLQVDKEAVEKIMPSDELEEKIFKILQTEERHMDEIARELGLQASRVSVKLTLMELKGMVRGLGDGIYRRN